MGFRFEHTYQMPIEEYTSLMRAFERVTKGWRNLALVIIAVAMLFSKWTVVLGCMILLISGFALFKPAMFKTAARETYSRMSDMKSPITYGVSDDGVSFRGSHLEAFSSWPNLVQWRELDGWLILQCGGMPWVFLPVSKMETTGVLDNVMQTVRKHGIEYNKPTGRA